MDTQIVKGKVAAVGRKFGAALKLEGEDSWLKAAHGYFDVIRDDLKGQEVELLLNGNGHIMNVKLAGASEAPVAVDLPRDVLISRQVAVKVAAELVGENAEANAFFRLAGDIEKWILRGKA